MRTAIVVLAALFCSAAASAAPTTRSFGDWDLMCTDTFSCTAETRGDGGALRIARHGEATYWEISFEPAGGADADAPFTVAVDDEAESFAGPDDIAAFGAPDVFYLLGSKAQAVMDRLAPGTALTIAYTASGAPAEAEFSLAGLTASLIFIDEAQRRLGSERVAEAPPVGLARWGETTGPVVPQKLLDALAADPQCRPIGELVHGSEIEIDGALGDGQKLYMLPCWDAAYNFGWKVYVELYEGEFEAAAFPQFSEAGGWTATNVVVNAWYDAGLKQVGSFYKGRGLGDCGSSGLWEWHEYGFRLLEFRDKPDCEVEPPEEQVEFPLVYSAPSLRAN